MATKITRIRKNQTLRDQVYDSLRKALFRGAFEPGERVTEERVAELLGVSRTPVREALNLLGQQGILEPRVGGGYIFPSPSLQEIEDVFEIRRILEPYAARNAVKFCTGADIDHLLEIVEREKELVEKADATESFKLNLEFRRHLFSLGGNRRLERILDEFMDHLHFIGILTLRDVAVRWIIISGHENLIRQLKSRDEDAMERATRDHVEAAYQAVINQVKKTL